MLLDEKELIEVFMSSALLKLSWSLDLRSNLEPLTLPFNLAKISFDLVSYDLKRVLKFDVSIQREITVEPVLVEEFRLSRFGSKLVGSLENGFASWLGS